MKKLLAIMLVMALAIGAFAVGVLAVEMPAVVRHALALETPHAPLSDAPSWPFPPSEYVPLDDVMFWRPIDTFLPIGRTVQIRARFFPSNATNAARLTWEVSDPSTVSVTVQHLGDSVVTITGVAPGETTVTVTTICGDFSQSIDLVVDYEDRRPQPPAPNGTPWGFHSRLGSALHNIRRDMENRDLFLAAAVGVGVMFDNAFLRNRDIESLLDGIESIMTRAQEAEEELLDIARAWQADGIYDDRDGLWGGLIAQIVNVRQATAPQLYALVDAYLLPSVVQIAQHGVWYIRIMQSVQSILSGPNSMFVPTAFRSRVNSAIQRFPDLEREFEMMEAGQWDELAGYYRRLTADLIAAWDGLGNHSIFFGNPPANPFPMAWHATMPAWIQWILRWIFFGWIWM
ncbi:MAG: Ig-like domain-containing protein [Oscillospiraceae bacterium]|nr:Ig-like domain-containing protein [Oscillospiraceae bacterium]